MKIAVIGTGYVGLVTATCFAELGHHVIGVDIDEAKIEKLRSGKSPIYEPGLEELMNHGIQRGSLTFTTDLVSILPEVDIVFCAVATPPGEGHKADLRAVFTVAETVANHVEKMIVFVNKSTVPVGTGKKCEVLIRDILKKRKKNFSMPVVSNPEFLREGLAVSDTLKPDRVIVGINNDPEAKSRMEELYRPLTQIGRPILFMSRESAEIVKYVSNSYLATRISFINMVSEFAELTGGDIRDIAAGMGLDHRIGPHFLEAGIGYGGSCFPKDVKAFMATASEYNLSLPIIEATDAINAHQRKRFLERLLKTVPTGSTIAIWGLSFKPKTDDMREAPSIDFITALLKEGYKVKACDPFAIENAKKILPPGVTYIESALEAATDADAVVLLTEWDMFSGIDLEKLKEVMRGTHIFDGRLTFDPDAVEKAGLTYHGIGIGSHL